MLKWHEPTSTFKFSNINYAYGNKPTASVRILKCLKALTYALALTV